MSDTQEVFNESLGADGGEQDAEDQVAAAVQATEDENANSLPEERDNDAHAAEAHLADSELAQQERVIPGALPESEIHEFSGEDIDLTEVESQLQSLVPAVLNLTEHVTQAAELNGDFRDEMEQSRTHTDAAIRRYQAAAEQQKKYVTIMLSVSIAVLLICSGLIGITAVSYSKQSNNMNAMSLALSKRIGEVSSGLATFEQINSNLALLNQSVESLQLDSELMRNEYASFKDENRSLISNTLADLNDNLESQAQNLSDRFALAESRYQATDEGLARASDAIVNLGDQVDSASSKAEQLLGVQQALDALVVLEQEKYLEQMQAQLEATRASEETDPAMAVDAGLIQYSRLSDFRDPVESE